MKGYKFCLHKAYFEQGMGLLNYPKYIVVLAGGGSVIATSGKSTFLAIIGLVVFGVFAYFIGKWWFKQGFKLAEIEVSNQFNLFVKEVRKRKSI